MTRLMAILLGSAATMGACSAPPPASLGGFHSPDPASKLYAIHQAGERGDKAAIPLLVEQLDSDDPAVRMMTIQALHRITMERFDYNPYASPTERRRSIAAWTAAVRSGRFTHKPTDAAPHSVARDEGP